MIGYTLTKAQRTLFNKWLGKFFYLKLCFNRTHGGYFGVFIDLFRDLTIISVAVKLYFDGAHPLTVVPVFLLLLVLWILFGHWDVKNKFAKLEQSVINRNTNPELMKIYHNSVRRYKNGEKIHSRRTVRD